MTGEKNGIGVMTRELTFDELVVESQYLYVLKSQIGEITKMPRLVTAKCPRRMSCFSH